MQDNRQPTRRVWHAGSASNTPCARRRKSLRLRQFDYTQAGAYFVTVCTRNRRCLFGNVVGGEMELNDFGRTADITWAAIPRHFSHAETPVWVVMPNHVHGIVVLTRPPRATPAPSATHQQPTGTARGSLATIVGSYKSAVSKQINRLRHGTGASVWQRSYFEHVIRDESSFATIWQYIADNPARWPDDPENPANTRATHASPLPRGASRSRLLVHPNGQD